MAGQVKLQWLDYLVELQCVGIAPHREEEKDDRSRKQEEGTDQGAKDTVI